MKRSELLEERHKIAERITRLSMGHEFWDDEDRQSCDLFLCLCQAHGAICEELRMLREEHPTPKIRPAFDAVIRWIEREYEVHDFPHDGPTQTIQVLKNIVRIHFDS